MEGANLNNSQAAIFRETEGGASIPTTRHLLSRHYHWASKQASSA